MKPSYLISCLLIAAGFIFSCNKSKKTVTPTCDGSVSTYNSNVKTIIDANCTSSGCHPTYNSYLGIKPVLTNGQFASHVLSKQDMPQKSSLSNDQLNKIQCWADAGYPEK